MRAIALINRSPFRRNKRHDGVSSELSIYKGEMLKRFRSTDFGFNSIIQVQIRRRSSVLRCTLT